MAFCFLPKDCISHILSFTSPKDVCQFCAISPIFQSAAESDIVWETFLPPDYQDILLRSVSPLFFSSMKDLYFKMTIPFIIDGGEMSFSLEKSTGKKCYRLSARKISITWADNLLYWTWKPVPQSRFAEVAELRTTYLLEIHAKMKTVLLSPDVIYGAYLILKIEKRAYGLDNLLTEVSTEVGNQQSKTLAYLCHCSNSKCQSPQGDGWLEFELGVFLNDGSEGDVKMSLKEVEGYHLKGGLVIEGIEVRPKEQ